MRTLKAAVAALVLCAGSAMATDNQRACQGLTNTIQNEQRQLKSLTAAFLQNMTNLVKAQMAMMQARDARGRTLAQMRITAHEALNKSLSAKIQQTQALLKMNILLAQKLNCPNAASAGEAPSIQPHSFAPASGAGAAPWNCVTNSNGRTCTPAVGIPPTSAQANAAPRPGTLIIPGSGNRR